MADERQDQAEQGDATTLAPIVSAGASVVGEGVAVYAAQSNKSKPDKPNDK